MPKITGAVKHDDKPFTGSLIITALNGSVTQYSVSTGKLQDSVSLPPGYYTASMVPEDSRKMSSYPQYKIRVPEGEEVTWDKIEIEQLV